MERANRQPRGSRPFREVFGAGLTPPQKQGRGLTAGEQQAREENRKATAGRKQTGMGRAQLGPTPRRQDARREQQAEDRDKTQPEEDKEGGEHSKVCDRPERNEGGEQQAEENRKATPAPE